MAPAMSGRPAAAVNAARTRLLPALLTALGVVLLTAGLLSYADPTHRGRRRRGLADHASS